MNWYVPILCAAVLVISASQFRVPVDIWGGAGVISRFLGFVQNLPGFYLAALAAIATFGSDSMQKLMPGKPPTMTIIHSGKPLKNQALTRRLFLSSMFAYLTGLSIILTVTAILALAVVDPVRGMLLPSSVPYVRASATFVYVVLSVQLFTITFWGLYYLGERLHLADS